MYPAPPVVQASTRVTTQVAESTGMTLAPGRPKVAGKTIVITGGSQGVGRAAALAFARKGWNVAVCARQPERLHQVAEELSRIRGGAQFALAAPADITREEQVEAFAQQVWDTFESIDVVVGRCCLRLR